MPRRLRYVAQPFWKAAHGFRAGEVRSFVCAMDAEDGGAILLRHADGVLVYQQWVDAEAEIMEEPEVLAILGDVPAGALFIDPPAADPWDLRAA